MKLQSVVLKNVRAIGKTASGTGWEGNFGFPKDSINDSIVARPVNRVLPGNGAVLLTSPHLTKARNGCAVG
jgi:trehalose utilization protein